MGRPTSQRKERVPHLWPCRTQRPRSQSSIREREIHSSPPDCPSRAYGGRCPATDRRCTPLESIPGHTRQSGRATRTLSALATHQDAQGISRERIGLSNSNVKKPDIVLLDEIRVIPEYRDG